MLYLIGGIIEREKQKEIVHLLGHFPGGPEWLELCLSETRSQELLLGLPRGYKGPST